VKNIITSIECRKKGILRDKQAYTEGKYLYSSLESKEKNFFSVCFNEIGLNETVFSLKKVSGTMKQFG